MKKGYRKKIRAFTLLEIVVAVSIAAMVAAIAIPAFNEYYDKSDDKAFRSECNNIKATASYMAKEEYKLRDEDISFLSGKLSAHYDGYNILAYAEKGHVLLMEIVREEDSQTMYYTDDLQFVREKPEGFYIDPEGKSGRSIGAESATASRSSAAETTVTTVTTTTTPETTTVTTTTPVTTTVTTTTPETTTVTTTTPVTTTVTTTTPVTTTVTTTTPVTTTVTTTTPVTTTVTTTTPVTTTVTTTTPVTTTVTTTTPETTTVTTTTPETTTVPVTTTEESTTTVPVTSAEETSAATTVPETTEAAVSESEVPAHGYSVSMESADLNYETWIDVSKYGNPKLLEWFSVEFEKSDNVARTTFYLGGYNPDANVVTKITGYDFFDTEGTRVAFDVDQTEFTTAPRYIMLDDWNDMAPGRGKITAVNFRFRPEPQFTPQSGSVKLDVKDFTEWGVVAYRADLSKVADKNFKSVTVEFENIGYKKNGQVIIENGQGGSFNMKYPDGKSITVPASAGENSNSLTVTFSWNPDPTDPLKVKNVYLNYDEYTVTEVPLTTVSSDTTAENSVPVTTIPVTTVPVTTSASETTAAVTTSESKKSAEGKDFEYDTWIDISQYGDPKLLEWFSIEFEKPGEYSSISVLLQGYNPHSDNKVWITGYSLNGSKETSAEFNVDQTEFETAPRYMMITEYNKDYGRGDITGIKFRFKSAPQFTPQNSSVKLDVKDTMVWGNAYYEADFSGVADKNFKSVTIEFENIGYKRTGTVSFTGDQKYNYYMKYSDGKAITVPVTPAGEIIDISVASHSDMNDTAVIKHIYLNYDN